MPGSRRRPGSSVPRCGPHTVGGGIHPFRNRTDGAVVEAMKKKQDNVEFAVFGEASSEVEGGSVRDHSPTHMAAGARLAFYLTVAGLLEAGISLEEAGDLVVNEYNASGQPTARKAAATFFEGLGKARSSADVSEVARRAFGRNFVGTEEMILLRSLPRAPNKAPVFRAAAAIVSLRYGATAEFALAAAARA